jgi:glycyl-tRNA synthetase
MNAIDMQQLVKQYNIKSPNTNNELSEPIAFNLMFSTSIGPTGQIKGLVKCKILYFVNYSNILIGLIVIFDQKLLKACLLILKDY